MRVLVVIQARTGSTRLPGKVLADLNGRPVLAHVVDRARRARSVAEVVVATTIGADDDAVVALCRSLGVATVRGPVEDVLTRYVMAARAHPADVVVRITADCPLLDWRLIDRVVGRLAREGAEYASNETPQTYPDGYDVEALTTACLKRVDGDARRPHEREHVTAHIRENLGLYRVATVTCRTDLSAVRLTVDLPSDLARARAVLAALPESPLPRLGAVVGLLRRRPGLFDATDHPGRDASYHAQRTAAGLAEAS